MSLKAGGVGLNLTAASNVFIMVTVNICRNIGYMHASGQALVVLKYLYSLFLNSQDPWWNPAVEEQAVMRIHRIGQKRRVCVRRFIVKVQLTFSSVSIYLENITIYINALHWF